MALYLRVSTDEQTTANQRRELEQVAAHHGWNLVEVLEDAGISGAKGRDQRPALDRLQDVTRGRFDMVAAWSVERLDRSLQDLIGILGELHAKRVDLLPAPAGRRHHHAGRQGAVPDHGGIRRVAMIQERVKAGIARARASGTKSGKPIGRARTASDLEAAIRRTLAKEAGIIKTAKMHDVGVGTVQRINLEAKAL